MDLIREARNLEDMALELPEFLEQKDYDSALLVLDQIAEMTGDLIRKVEELDG